MTHTCTARTVLCPALYCARLLGAAAGREQRQERCSRDYETTTGTKREERFGAELNRVVLL
ncbi:hypothetical protein E2C01_078104 [Portunus trituberculatus]|uniref:Secreted protein n=1 Tax=Portunus trituberculatus TaxID=210409 RepID=A0A5B7IM06_PORTR|nr:hypothetical protein [Portunus trituberculatus]